MQGAAAAIYSSDYMARRAIRETGPGLAAHVAPFGINLDVLPETCPQKSVGAPLELLFVCSDWARKGGDTVLATLAALKARGVAARLTVVGKVPGRLRRHPAMTYAGFLDKNRPAHAARLTALYEAAHLLLLPSRGDCTPMVVAEAFAHGTPVVTTDVGGMATLVAPGTGTMLDVAADATAWADAVQELTASRADYTRASQRAFSHASSSLTWEIWAKYIEEACRLACVRAIAA